MAAVAPEKNPFVTLDSNCCAEITGHVAWRLYYPKCSVFEEIHGSFKRPKLFPRAVQLSPSLGRSLRVEEMSVPLQVGFSKVSWRTTLLCPWPKIRCRVRKFVADWTSVVPMGVAFYSVNIRAFFFAALASYLKITESIWSGTVPLWRSCSTIDLRGPT